MDEQPSPGLAQSWSCESLQNWFSGAYGRALLAAELRLLGELLPALPGRQIVQFGVPVAADLLAASRCRGKLSLCSDSWMASDSLPLSEAATDVLLLPHSLEFAAQPRMLLAAVRRVLVDGGHLLLLFFNARPPQSLGALLGDHRPGGRRALSTVGGGYAAQAKVLRLLAEQALEIQTRRDLYCFSLPGAPREGWWVSPAMSWSRFLPGSVCVLLCRKQGVPLIPLHKRWAAGVPKSGDTAPAAHCGRGA